MENSGAINEMDARPMSIPARLPLPRSRSIKLAANNIMPSLPPPSSASELGFPNAKNITPEMPAHYPSSSCHETGAASSADGCSKHNQSPTAFSSFFGSRSQAADTAASQQPRSLKNHDVLHNHDRLKLEPFSPTEDSSSEFRYRNIPSFISTQLDESPMEMSPMLGGLSSGKSPNKKRSMEGRSESSTRSEDEQPHTPKYRCLLQGLSLNSPSRSSASTTPDEAGGSVQQSPYRRPPNIPSFIKKKKESIMLTDSFESQSFSAANTPIRTPETGQFYMRSSEKVSTPTTASSSFYSTRSNRTSIGHQNSPFKMLPPRLGDQSQGSTDTPEMIHSNYSPFVSSPTRYASSPTRFASSSPYASSPTRFGSSSPLMTSSPSPRVVPLKILSRDGSPVEHAKLASATGAIPKLGMDHLPYDPSTSSQAMMSSPLMRSLDKYAKKDSMEQMNNEDGKEDTLSGAAMPSLHGESSKPTKYGESPKSKDYPQLPRIKLTPRSKSNYASLMLDASPRGATLPPRLNLLASSSGPLLRKRPDNSGDKEDLEMDSLLSGFGHHNSNDDEPRNGKQKRSDSLLDRVESEESEMVAIARTPLMLPSFCAQAKDKPMKSITFKTPEHDREESLSSPSFLPRFVPASKSRSLFNSPRVDDPIEQIIRADAIAEAAKSNEELTDDESDSEGPGSDFLLCSPKAYSSKMLHKMEKRPTKAALPVKPGHRAESPSFGRARASSIGSLKKRTRSFSSPTTPTIAEEGLASFDATFSKSTTSNECTHQGFGHRDRSAATLSSYCSLSDCDDTTIHYHHSHTMPLSIDIGMKNNGLSMTSMTSLCGLDIVDESVDEFRDKVPASLPSESSQIFKHAEGSDICTVGLRRSEFSQNSLGLSVDSVGDADQRDLFTPPLTTTRNLQSPPPLPKRTVNYQYL
eukprot:scaffold4942_cov182-Skeletonema_marinoi.AAC.4